MQTPEHIPSNLSSDAAPTTVTEAEELLINAALTNDHCEKALKVLKVIGAHNAKRATKLKVIALKIIQRTVKFQDLHEVIANGSADCGTHLELLSSMMTSTVKLTRQPDGSENV
ncbi:hypothetical protein BWQ96_06801 [Gracilariopsis chorda]|uniref:Uncharacterized protein n=1 Tax=Gracilariopsis chorda TaxID=448386 RepID=A0A2V3IMU9_9FLOR|nr:hypothetical protein BWQ96_06801 [Gracilariopsis chorda]|eukprot:PXF43411.1 hypothetical protein BWQ96_06801 [Gracilariopsis chorda]